MHENPSATQFSVIHAILECVQSAPHHIAIHDGTRSLTYLELKERAENIANWILKGSHRNDLTGKRVAFLSSSAMDGIAAMVGIALSGRAWVALDERQPEARLGEIVSDAAIDLIVVDAGKYDVAVRLGFSGSSIVRIEDDCPEVCEYPILDPNDIAYILYTSGSTGKPKGVMQSYGNLGRHISTCIERFSITEKDRMTLIPAVSTDAALMDIFSALCRGATLFACDMQRLGQASFPAWLETAGITFYHSTPTVFRLVFGSLSSAANIASVKKVVLGGEPAFGTDVKLFQNHFSEGAVLINGFGPTECTVALQQCFQFNEPEYDGVLPIGFAVPGIEAVVLDESLREAADIGEIALYGAPLAVGYLNLPELSAQKFVINPENKRRMYLTGDLGLRLPDGRLIHKGRKDTQLKIFGNRIEAAEVETAIKDLTQTDQVFVMKLDSDLRKDTLAGVIVSDDDCLDIDALRAKLALRLPAYMIPSVISTRKNVPLTFSGKVDFIRIRKELEEQIEACAGEHDAEMTPMEQRIAALYGKIFGKVKLRGSSNFFYLGGHSLLAQKLAGLIFAEFGIDVGQKFVLQNPTVSQLAEALAEKPSTATEPMVPESVEIQTGSIPLSVQQKGIFLSQELTPDSPIYNLGVAVELPLDTDLDALRDCFDKLVAKTAVLNVAVVASDSGLTQHLRTDTPPEFSVMNSLGSYDGFDASSDLRRFRDKIFDLRDGEMVRACVAITGDSTVLLIAGHHFAIDGIGLRLFLAALLESYDKRTSDRPCSVEPLDSRYFAYIKWQEREIQQRSMQSENVSKRRVSDSRVTFPAERAAATSSSFRCSTKHFKFGALLAEQLRQCSQRQGQTVYTTCLAIFSLLISRHSGESEFTVASPVANRYPSEMLEVIGNFASSASIPVKVDENLLVSEYYQLMSDCVAECVHGAVLTDDDSHDFNRTDGLNLQPFDVMFAVQNFDMATDVLQRMSAKILPLDQSTVLSKMCLTIHEDTKELECDLQYNSDLFTAEWIDSFTAQFLRLTDSFIKGNNRQLRTLDMMEPSDFAELVVKPAVDLDSEPDRMSIASKFLEHARAHPDALAFVLDERRIRYAQMAGDVMRTAKLLEAEGVGIGDFVPVIGGSDAYQIAVCWLSVIARGAAFVPIDFTWPSQRIIDSKNVCEAKVCLCFEEFEVAPELSGLPVIRPSLDETPGAGFEVSCAEFRREDPVYAFFTSGSTGKPKLAVVPHRGINNRFSWMTQTFAADGPPVTLHTTPHYFDSAVWQLLWPLTCCGTAVTTCESSVHEVDNVIRILERFNVTIVDFVPTIFDEVVRRLESRIDLPSFSGLRFLILGGEMIRKEAAFKFRKWFGSVQMLNLYGPTEASIGCVYRVVQGNESTIPIGLPIPNVNILMLDKYDRLTPHGVPGQICIVGECVGLGYKGDQANSAKSFIPNPYSEVTGYPILYKTGDVGMVGADGQLYFVGRMDDEIKIRGVRLSPLEIERSLDTHPSIDRALVDVKLDVDGKSRLCVTLWPSVPDGIREFCIDHLPLSHVPELYFHGMDLAGATGAKFNRRLASLKSVADAMPYLYRESGLEKKGMSTVVEIENDDVFSSVAETWKKVLAVDELDHDSHFFNLGGNSLKALTLKGVLEKDLAMRVKLVDIFRYPSLGAFVKHCGK